MTARRVTQYSLGYEGNHRHSQLLQMGPWADEDGAKAALASVMGWSEAHLSPIFQVSREIAAFAAFGTAEERDIAIAPYPDAPRVFQQNAEVDEQE